MILFLLLFVVLNSSTIFNFYDMQSTKERNYDDGCNNLKRSK